MPGKNQPTAYRWDELAVDHPMAMIERRRVIGKQAMISYVKLEKGCRVPTHHHENEQFACILSGRLKFTLGDEGSEERREVTVSTGGIFYVPANAPHAAEAMEDTVVLDVFAPPSETTGIDRD